MDQADGRTGRRVKAETTLGTCHSTRGRFHVLVTCPSRPPHPSRPPAAPSAPPLLSVHDLSANLAARELARVEHSR
jgi:hypothetical protein